MSDIEAALLDQLDHTVMQRQGQQVSRAETRFRCPAENHPDEHPSARWNRTKAAWCCDACGVGGGALDLANRLGIPRPGLPGVEGMHTLAHRTATVQQPLGCTLEQYAKARHLPIPFLQQIGLSTISYPRSARRPHALLDA